MDFLRESDVDVFGEMKTENGDKLYTLYFNPSSGRFCYNMYNNCYIEIDVLPRPLKGNKFKDYTYILFIDNGSYKMYYWDNLCGNGGMYRIRSEEIPRPL